MRRYVLLLLAVGLGACSNSDICPFTTTCVALRSTTRDAAGPWTEAESWNGRVLRFTLSANDTSLAGSGTYDLSGSPGEGGTLKVRGYVFWQEQANTPGGSMPAQPVVVLHLALSDGTSARFDQGSLEASGALIGVLTFAGDNTRSYGTEFVRGVP